MQGLINRVLGRRSKGSGALAKERLQFILVHDRVSLPPEQLAAMKKEILEVISRYVPVDDARVDIALQQRDHGNMIVAEIPFLEQPRKASESDGAYQALANMESSDDSDAAESGSADDTDE